MLRLIGFFVLVIFTRSVLGMIPVIREILGALGIFGFWAVAIFVGWYLNALTLKLVSKRRFDREVRDLDNVDTPRNQGKLGNLFYDAGKFRAACKHLQVAHEGQPESLEWRFGLAKALLALGENDEAAEHFQAVATVDASYGYGRVLLGLAEARQESSTSRGADIALQALERHDTDRGATPESALLRGLVFKSIGRKDAARAAFASVGGLARNLPASRRREAFPFQVRAFFARLS
ncbi:MAG: tetratricopeptide repeat protein [Planctomycetota bacterium]|nr:tetratricopeptide repeat protein [Planctomycetota bacterium]